MEGVEDGNYCLILWDFLFSFDNIRQTAFFDTIEEAKLFVEKYCQPCDFYIGTFPSEKLGNTPQCCILKYIGPNKPIIDSPFWVKGWNPTVRPKEI